MRGIYNTLTEYRRKVFTEVAKFAFSDEDYSVLENTPYKIVPGERAKYRESIFLERAIVAERIRLALGLPLRKPSQHAPVSSGITENLLADNYYDGKLVNIIKFACNSCPDNQYKVTDQCRGCLARPCTLVCPKNAVSFVNGKSFIDDEKCIRCGKCKEACPYGAILKLERPCARSCGMNAIHSDEYGRADINYDLCVSCGMCISNCPFGAISDKSQIYQLVQAIKRGEEVIAEVAPAFVGQFGAKVTPEKLKDGLLRLGFKDVYEVAIGADLCTIEEAHDFMENVPSKVKFMATSCCPAWSVMAKKLFPEFKENISMAMTPMVLTARFIKQEHPKAKVVFIGPCAAKKLEASRSAVKSHVDYVLTFEEMMGLFLAKDIDLEALEGAPCIDEGTGPGRGFAVTGGVAAAVVKAIKEIDPEREVLVESADGLAACVALMKQAKAGKKDGYLLEGMACPGGCVAGTGTLQPIKKSQIAVNRFANSAEKQNSVDSNYAGSLDSLASQWFDDWHIDWESEG